MNRFVQRVVIVTGASSGLGVAIARAFAAEGARVTLAARNADRLRQTATGLSGEVLTVACDIAKSTDVDNLIQQTIARFGRLDILVNNAGVGMVAPVEFVEMPDAVALFETNFFGALHCIQAALPHLKQQRRAHIVNVASISGLRAIPNIAIYSAAKAALIALSDSLRIELRGSGIGVTVVCPGRIADTAFFERLTRYGPLKLYEGHQTVTPDAVAQAILDAILKRRRLVILPSDARLLYRVNKLAPRLVDHMLHKKMPKLERA
jgi:short-subunit dehydrogenase